MLQVIKRVLPLALSALSLLGILHLIPQMYWDFQFSRHGVSTSAWYVDLNQDKDSFGYAYKVGDTVFGGEASWNDADSDIYLHKVGDECRGVEYLPARPWRSMYSRNAEEKLHWDKVWMGWLLVTFFLGILLSRRGIRLFRPSTP